MDIQSRMLIRDWRASIPGLSSSCKQYIAHATAIKHSSFPKSRPPRPSRVFVQQEWCCRRTGVFTNFGHCGPHTRRTCVATLRGVTDLNPEPSSVEYSDENWDEEPTTVQERIDNLISRVKDQGDLSALSVASILNVFPYKLDKFQRRSIEALMEGTSVVVSAPTSSGKTTIAEAAAISALARGKRVIYTTPLKALSNQKCRDLGSLLGVANVGLLTGDVAINSEAPLVVMTTEILRNMLYSSAGGGEADERLRNVDIVVLDEVHYLSDAERGTVWEETVIYLPKDIKLLCLSATIGNAEELTQWIETVHGPTLCVTSKHRPVPLVWRFSTNRGMFALLSKDGNNMGRELWELGRKAVSERRGRGGGQAEPSMADRRRLVPTQLDTMEQLKELKLLPAVWIIFSRRQCDAAVFGLPDMKLVSKGEVARIKAAVDKLQQSNPEAVRHQHIAPLMRGVASHHAGILPAWKLLIEQLFQEGLIKVIFATETLAAGLNMPARTAVLSTVSKRGDNGHELLTTNTLLQIAGRAGRRGMDSLGHVVVMQSPFEGPEEVCRLLFQGPEPLRSQFTVNYGMVLNLLKGRTLADAQRVVERSFGNYMGSRGQQNVRKRLRDAEAKCAKLALEIRDAEAGRLEGVTEEEWMVLEGHRQELAFELLQLQRAKERLCETLAAQLDARLQAPAQGAAPSVVCLLLAAEAGEPPSLVPAFVSSKVAAVDAHLFQTSATQEQGGEYGGDGDGDEDDEERVGGADARRGVRRIPAYWDPGTVDARRNVGDDGSGRGGARGGMRRGVARGGASLPLEDDGDGLPSDSEWGGDSAWGELLERVRFSADLAGLPGTEHDPPRDPLGVTGSGAKPEGGRQGKGVSEGMSGRGGFGEQQAWDGRAAAEGRPDVVGIGGDGGELQAAAQGDDDRAPIPTGSWYVCLGADNSWYVAPAGSLLCSLEHLDEGAWSAQLGRAGLDLEALRLLAPGTRIGRWWPTLATRKEGRRGGIPWKTMGSMASVALANLLPSPEQASAAMGALSGQGGAGEGIEREAGGLEGDGGNVGEEGSFRGEDRGGQGMLGRRAAQRGDDVSSSYGPGEDDDDDDDDDNDDGSATEEGDSLEEDAGKWGQPGVGRDDARARRGGSGGPRWREEYAADRLALQGLGDDQEPIDSKGRSSPPRPGSVELTWRTVDPQQASTAVSAQRARVSAVKRRLKSLRAHQLYRKAARRLKNKDRKLLALEDKVDAMRRQLGSLGQSGWKEFTELTETLVEAGALEPGTLQATELGENCAAFRGTNELWLGLAFTQSALHRLPPVALAGACAAFVVGDCVRREEARCDYGPSQEVTDAMQALAPSMRRLAELQRRNTLQPPFDLDLRFVGLVEAWASGASWSETMADNNLDDGDVARLLRRTMDLLAQLPHLPHLPPSIKATAAQAVKLLDRPPISEMY